MSKINGKAKKYDGTAIDYVQIFNWANGNCMGVSKTDAAGNWACDLYGKVSVGITYVADGCEPITHGAYQFDFPSDEYWSSVSLLMSFEKNINDKAAFNSFGVFGNIDYNDGRFGDSIVFLPSSSASKNGLLGYELSSPNLTLGSGDFTVEFFLNPSNAPKQADQALLSLFDTTGYAGWQVLLSNLKPSVYKYDSGGNTFLKSATALNAAAWYHLAWCRLNGVSSLYVDGVLAASASDSSVYNPEGMKLSIGYQENGASHYPFSGAIDELRITRGVARYNGNFTPPDSQLPAG